MHGTGTAQGGFVSIVCMELGQHKVGFVCMELGQHKVGFVCMELGQQKVSLSVLRAWNWDSTR